MLIAAGIIFTYFLIFFIVATIIKNNSIVDIGWGLGYVVTVWILYAIYQPQSWLVLVLNIMVSLWGLRLFYYILKRNVFQEEDFRYKNWRKAWGKYVIPRAFVQVFMLQGFFMYVIGSSAFYANVNDVTWNPLSIIGMGVFLLGYLYEVVGDAQLKAHIKHHKGTLMTTGLWKYTRHPNYFGESVLWFGIFMTAWLSGVPWFFVIGPLTITLILYFISTPLLEERMQKKDGWQAYVATTNKFFPGMRD
ncbi:DUF1295 domain-containing protein [Candidatus Xianfuyuplasma coldseepsis]|uniref:DUF1295 domain-containing protein n=1 Tax=Candidatus Xianfuyuplasma coldseepsis TaxID=2782163 RepID=A0A7L7KSE0_9MOLU|nr:DUF1295 domain-containing protein [Xianfuyuplasma coldseepsis]QMS85329.1 DUF1295 domain-containing protein [Xianfuyuplasma coldseepsis]